MSGHRMASRILAPVVLALVTAGPVAGQDVMLRGRMHGTELPERVRRALALDPDRYEFRRAWTAALREVKAVRARLAAQGLEPHALSPVQAAQYGAAVTGTYRVPTFTALYDNTGAEPYPAADLQARLYDGPQSPLTLREFYDEISRGAVTLTGTVHDWVRVSQPDTYYEGDNNGLDPQTDNTGDLIREVLDAVDPDFDFAPFDTDGDGYVDFIALIHPELGGECGGTGNIWSHRFLYRAWTDDASPYLTDDGVYVDDYVIQPAVACDGATPIQIGIFAHEFGHAFGLPDLYATNGANDGLGHWGLMASGNWNRPSSPAHMSAWSKMEMGWMPVQTVSQDMAGLHLDPAEGTGSAVRIDLPGAPDEHFLLENRQRLGSDQHLAGTGLLIYHVDDGVIANTRAGNALQNETDRKGVDVEAADGRTDIDLKVNRGDDGDIFPGTTGATAFADNTSPGANTNAGDPTGIALTNIAESGQMVTLDVDFGAGGVAYWGDVTGEGMIDASDVETVLEELVGLDSGADVSRADVDADADVDIRDALILHSFVEGIDVSDFRVGQPASGSPPTVVVQRGEPAGAASVADLRKILDAGRRP